MPIGGTFDEDAGRPIDLAEVAKVVAQFGKTSLFAKLVDKIVGIAGQNSTLG